MHNVIRAVGSTPTLTEEQAAVVASTSESMAVVAFAGTGKTTVLQAYARARPEQRMLYLAFNSAIAAEARAKFPGNVSCLTSHSLAYRAIGYRYRPKLAANVRAHQGAIALGLNPTETKDLGLAEAALSALKHWLCSDSPDFSSFNRQHPKRYPSGLLHAAQRLWELMSNPRDQRVPMLHDGYLKLYQLSAPRLGYDTILFDEAQDANPVTLALLRQQSCRRVFVGDPHQAIYQFRHASNAMEDPLLVDRLYLTESFRFGEEIADAANRLLGLKREPRSVQGRRTQPPSASTAFLARGNAAIFAKAVELARQEKQAVWTGGIKGYRLEQLLDVWRLKAGEGGDIRDPFLRGFKSFHALAAYVEVNDQRDLKAWVNLVERHERWELIPAEVEQVKRFAVEQPAPGVMTLATAHKSKGLEFGSVTLAEDFPEAELLYEPESTQYHKPPKDPGVIHPENHPLLWDRHGFRGAVVLPEEELNLRYVAVTRAEHSCTSVPWGSPLFSHLSAYARQNPRFLLVDSAAALKPAKDEAPNHENSVKPPAASPVVPVSSGALAWFFGSLDPAHVRTVKEHYCYRYPALNWQWLLQVVAEQRVTSPEPAAALEDVLAVHRLDSARALVERFLLDVGLVIHLEG